MPRFQDSLRSGAAVDDMMCFHSHPAKWWDSWKQHPDGNSVCRRRVWQVGGALTVVVLTEVERNEGMSVTNAYERLAAMTLNDFPELDLGKIVWIEHEAPQIRHKGENEELDLVRVTGLHRVQEVWRSEDSDVAWRFLWKRDGQADAYSLPAPLLALKRWLLAVNVDLLTDLAEIRAHEPGDKGAL